MNLHAWWEVSSQSSSRLQGETNDDPWTKKHGTSNITGWLFDFCFRPKWVFYDPCIFSLAPPLLPSFPDTSAPWCQHLRPWQQWFDEFFFPWNLDSSWAPGCLGDLLGIILPSYRRDSNKPWSLGIRFCWTHTSCIFDLGTYFFWGHWGWLNTSKGWLFAPFAWNCV